MTDPDGPVRETPLRTIQAVAVFCALPFEKAMAQISSLQAECAVLGCKVATKLYATLTKTNSPKHTALVLARNRSG